MSERVPCSACGASILLETAQRNEGLCMPCKRGYRKDIEASKVRHEEEKKYREGAEHKHWHWLVDQVYKVDAGFAKLSRENQLFFATNVVIGEVYNGGFDQYFHNSAADYFNLAIEGLTIMQASKSLALLLSAKTLLFGELDVPSNAGERRQLLQAQSEAYQEILESLDKEFWADPDELSERMTRYAKEHDLHKNF